MEKEVSYTRIKEGFYLITSPEVRESSWYLTRKAGKGTYAEIADDPETGVFIAPWPFNKHIIVEEFSDPDRRRIWDESSISEVIRLAYDEIARQLADSDQPSSPSNRSGP